MRPRSCQVFRGPFAIVPIVLIVLTLAGAPAVPAVPVSVDGLKATIERLTDSALSGRRSGTPGAFEAADYIFARFTAMGLETQFQELDERRRNVVARFGDAAEHIVVGAHYDGQGRGNPGASDNAAGVAVMLELARDLTVADLPVSVVFIAFDDEEQGLNGARYYADNPVYPLSETRTAVILDTMGRSFIDLDRWFLMVLGTEMSQALAAIVAAEAHPATIPIGTDLIGARSDFAPFAARRVPYLFFTNATHADYHGPGDTPDAIRYDRLRDDAEMIGNVIEAIAALSERPVYEDEPVYPAAEAESLLGIVDLVENERPDLAGAYGVLFDDARVRVRAEASRVNLRVATEVLLAAATPRFAFFSLAYLLGPLYETENNIEAALAAYREAVRMAPDAATRNTIQEKIDALET